MDKEKPNRQTKSSKEGYVIVPNYFLREWVSKIGIGPALLYLELLTYCHKEKYIVWPSLTTLSNQLGISKNSLISYQKTLLKYGLIKKIIKRRNIQGNYQSNFYKITPIDSTKNELRQVQILGEGSAKITLGVVQNLHPNNNNLNNNNTTTRERKDAVVDFKKLKEEGVEKMLVIKEQLRDLGFEGKFIEQLLKDFSPKKIEEKLDLLMERRNIQNPAGWLMAALKNDYQDVEEERYEEEPAGQVPQLLRIDSRFRGNDIKGSGNDISTPEQVSREKALEAIKLIQGNLSACISPLPQCRGSIHRTRKTPGRMNPPPTKNIN